MATQKLNLTRDQLATFLKNFEQIKQFERLFQVADEVSPSSDTTGISIQAGNAEAAANDALAQLQRIGDLLALIATAPTIENNNSVVTDYIDLPEIGPHITQARRVQWNQDDGTLDVGLYGGSVLQVGQELMYYAKNTSGGLIANGTPVMFTGTVGASGKLTFGLAVSDGSVLADYMMGVATQDIANNAFGYVTSFGLVRGFNTTGAPYGEVWADGDLLYFDPAAPGTWTNVQPAAPNIAIPVAVVVNAGLGGSGSIFVRMELSESLRNLQDVYVSPGGPTDLDLLQYNATNNRWETGQVAWLDIDFPILIRTTGANIPTLTTVNGNLTMPQWSVNDFNVCESQEFIHSWKEGSTVYWHLHMTTNGLEAVDKYVRFELEYGYANANGAWTFPAVFTTPDILIPANTPDKTMLVVSITNFTPAGLKIGAHALARLKRVASVGAAPAADPWVPMLQMHIQLNTLGSRNIGTK